MGQPHNDDPPVEVKKSMAEQWNPDGNVHDSPVGLFWFRVGPSPLEINR